MYLVVGLGNPGKEYEHTRHNVGFMAVDKFEQCRDSDPLHVILLKPQNYMNNSGREVKALYTKHHILPTNLLVIHDDIDIPLGKIKISKGAGAAGHKGVASIIKALKTKDFIRIRIGIEPKNGKPENVETFVIKNFAAKELPILEAALTNACTALSLILNNKLDKAMNEFNS